MKTIEYDQTQLRKAVEFILKNNKYARPGHHINPKGWVEKDVLNAIERGFSFFQETENYGSWSTMGLTLVASKDEYSDSINVEILVDPAVSAEDYTPKQWNRLSL